MKTIKIVLITLILAGCSQYSHRMVRVKSHPTIEQKQKKESQEIRNANLKSALVEEEAYYENQKVVSQDKVDSIVEPDKNIQRYSSLDRSDNFDERVTSKVVNRIKRIKRYPPEAEVRRMYKNANTMSIVSLVMLLVGVFLGVTILVSLILSAIALSTYKNYENPGVLERKSMAKTVFIVSVVLIGIGLLLLGLYLYIFLLI